VNKKIKESQKDWIKSISLKFFLKKNYCCRSAKVLNFLSKKFLNNFSKNKINYKIYKSNYQVSCNKKINKFINNN